MKIRFNILNSGMIICIFLLVFYTVFYQHAVGSIDGFLTILGLMMLGLSIFSTAKDIRKVKKIAWIIAFLVAAFCSGFFFHVDGGTILFNEFMLSSIKYFIVLYCIYCFIDGKRKKLTLLMTVIWISVLTLAVYTLINGTTGSVYYGGVTIGDLNKNMLSAYITLGMFANIYLLCYTKKQGIKIIFILTFVLDELSQLNTASRTGAIASLILFLGFVHTIYTIQYENKWVSRITMIFICLIGLGCFFLSFSRLSELFIVFERLQGKYIVGDSLRKQLHAAALELFKQHPLFGNGFGCVATVCGTYAHSLYYELLASVGLIGVVILFIPIMKYLLEYYKISLKCAADKDTRILARLMCWSIGLVCVTGVAQIYIYYIMFYIYIAIWIGTMEVITNEVNILDSAAF